MIRAKKSLGQNFLTSESARRAIIEVSLLSVEDTVLEVGPGEGFLTHALLATGATVIAVEKDDRLIEFLNEKFHPEIVSKKLTLIHGDILNFLEAKSYLPDDKAGHLEAPYKLVANIPYYLTGQIIRQFLTAENQPQSMTLMLQKEVANRIVAKDARPTSRRDKESLLSISVKAYGEPHYIKTVPRGAFHPVPKVDSAILYIDKISRDRFTESKITEENFFALLHLGFAGKRKMLRSKLNLPAEDLNKGGVSPTARAEDVMLEQWFVLAKIKNRPRVLRHETDNILGTKLNLGNATRGSEDPK